MLNTHVAIILSGLAGQPSSELVKTAKKILNFSAPETMQRQIVIALPSEAQIPAVKDKRIQFAAADSELALYYQLPRELDADYVSILSADTCYSSNIFEKLERTLTRYPNRSIFVCKLASSVPDYTYLLNRAFQNRRELSVLAFPKRIWVNPEGAFFQKELLDRLPVPEYELLYYVPNLFMLQAEYIAGSYVLISNAEVTAPFTYEDQISDKACYFDKTCYFDLFRAFSSLFAWQSQTIPKIPAYFQYSFLYFLRMAFAVNFNANTKHIIKDEVLTEYKRQLNQVLSYISDEVLMNTRCGFAKLNANIRYQMLRQKYGKENEPNDYWFSNNEIALLFDGKPMFIASAVNLQIHVMELQKNMLTISGVFPFPIDDDRFQLVAEFDQQMYPATVSHRFAYFKIFGEIVYNNYCFDITVPLQLGKGDLRFYLVNEETNTKVNLDISYAKPRALLGGENTYYSKGRFLLYHKARKIMVRKNTKKRRLSKELGLWKSLLSEKKYEALQLRVLYCLTRPFFRRKPIWIFFDKIYKGGDNGEYLYRYCLKQKDGIRKCYVLRDDVPDAKRFKAEKIPYVKYGSLLHRLLFLNATTVFATHCNATTFNTFFPSIESYFRGLFSYDLVCIQHGLTVQDIPNFQNRIVDNTKLYTLASPAEWNNLDTELYDYQGRDILRPTGLARYDGLVDQREKTILITPTWRNYLAIPSNSGHARGYNALFRESSYFQIYNSLINNPDLLAAARKYGYKIKFLLHPVTSSQKDDYDTNEFVEIVAATDDLSYEDIMTHSALMVTDYSGVQFDFAYMYKPVVYYHPTALPASYNEGFGYHMATDALGEIVHEEKELVDLLIQYMSEDCQLHPEYRKRIDNFFYHHDHNNCQRIYEAVQEFYRQKRSPKKKANSPEGKESA